MKKIISFVLAAVLLVSAVPTALATNNYDQGTQVVYEATGSESYTITVPAKLAPGGSGTVTLQGTWADNRIITVTAEPTVTLTNSIKAEDQKVLNVHFDGISEAGSNTTSQTFTRGISVDGITDALFGTWSGKFNYNVNLSDNMTAETISGSYISVNDVHPTTHNLSVNLNSDTITDFSNVTVTKTGKNLLDMSTVYKTYVHKTDSEITSSAIDANNNSLILVKTTPANSQCGLSFKVYLHANTYTISAMDYAGGGYDGSLHIYDSAGNKVKGIDVNVVNIKSGINFNIAESGYYEFAFFVSYSAPENTVVEFNNIQLEIGDAKTDFELYTKQTVTASADGTVSGLKSVSPNMTIIADADVEITCEYQKKN